MGSFSPSCRCGQSHIESNYDYMEKVQAQIAEVKFQPCLGKPGSRLTGLKISRVIIIVFSPG